MENDQYLVNLQAHLKKDAQFSEKECLQIYYYARNLRNSNLPVIYDDNHFSSLVGYDLNFLYSVVNSPRKFYRSFGIKKKNGGTRFINEPLPALKSIHRWIHDNIGSKLPISKASKAYKKNSNIKDNARLHRKQDIILSMDIDSFFANCRVSHIYKLFLAMGYTHKVSFLISNIVSLDNGLPMGSPASPSLANALLYDFDETALVFSAGKNIRYSRYSDDLTFSGNSGIDTEIIKDFAVKNLSPLGMKLKYNKTRVMKNNNLQIVTGIVVNEKMNVLRKNRRRLRQEVYYINKFGIDQHLLREKIENSRHIDRLIAKTKFNIWVNKFDAISKKCLIDLEKYKQQYL